MHYTFLIAFAIFAVVIWVVMAFAAVREANARRAKRQHAAAPAIIPTLEGAARRSIIAHRNRIAHISSVETIVGSNVVTAAKGEIYATWKHALARSELVMISIGHGKSHATDVNRLSTEKEVPTRATYQPLFTRAAVRRGSA